MSNLSIALGFKNISLDMINSYGEAAVAAYEKLIVINGGAVTVTEEVHNNLVFLLEEQKLNWVWRLSSFHPNCVIVYLSDRCNGSVSMNMTHLR